jgi:TAT (twin-arginine translocation) pathway signal sequence.
MKHNNPANSTGTDGVDRRDFLKWSALLGGMAAVTGTGFLRL